MSKRPPLFHSDQRPECTIDSECHKHLACIQEKCQDPCYAYSCGQQAECRVRNHRAICKCWPGYIGHPYSGSSCQSKKTF